MADAAGEIISEGMADASSVSSLVASIMSGIALCSAPRKGI